MSVSLLLVVAVLVVALTVSVVVGRVLTRRDGVVRSTLDASAAVPDLGLPPGRPAVVHFSAQWCGPCAGVRQVVDQVCAELTGVAHVEIDMDANPEAARRLSVLSLPTTIIFDAEGRPRFRTHGVPKPADLRSALTPLLA